MVNCNLSSLNGNERKLVWEAEQYHLDIVGISSTKCHGSDTVELNEGWKLFYSGVNVTMSVQAGVGIFVRFRLAHYITDWIPLGGKTAWWNQKVKEAIHAKKTGFRAWLTNKSSEQL